MSFPRNLTRNWWLGSSKKCEHCRKSWYDGWKLEWHHKIPTSMGGDDSRENAILLCTSCHLLAHKRIEDTARISVQLIEKRLNVTKGRWK